MAEEIENHTIRLLQEMRAEMREMRADATRRADDTDRRLDDVLQRLDGNTLLLNLVAGVAHDHEQRLNAIEGPSS